MPLLSGKLILFIFPSMSAAQSSVEHVFRAKIVIPIEFCVAAFTSPLYSGSKSGKERQRQIGCVTCIGSSSSLGISIKH